MEAGPVGGSGWRRQACGAAGGSVRRHATPVHPSLLPKCSFPVRWCAPGSPRLLEIRAPSSCLPLTRAFHAPAAHLRDLLNISILQPVVEVGSGEGKVEHKVN